MHINRVGQSYRSSSTTAHLQVLPSRPDCLLMFSGIKKLERFAAKGFLLVYKSEHLNPDLGGT